MKTHLMRSVAAVATALVCLLASAAPASAVSQNLAATGGTFVLANGGTTAPFLLAPGSCPAGTLQMNTTATTAEVVTTVSLTRRLTIGVTNFVVLLTRTGSTVGTASGSSPATIAGTTLVLNVKIYTLTASTACTPNVLQCEFNVNVTLGGQHSGNPAAPAALDTVFLTGPAASLSTVGSCTHALLSPFVGGTGRIAGLTATVQ